MGLFDIFKKKTKSKEIEIIKQPKEVVFLTKSNENGIIATFEELPDNYGVDETKLVEIKDLHLISRISSLFPTNVGVNIENIKKDIKNAKEGLFKIDIKKSELVNSREKLGAKRAFSMDRKGMKKNANLTEIELDKKAVVANAGATVMSIASMAVGQYYMTQVDNQLTSIRYSLSRVIDFLDIQYKSQVESLVQSVYTISKFQISSIENEELRNRELDNVQRLKLKNQELLNQAESTLEMLISKKSANYEEYEKTVKEIAKWWQYQKILLSLLYQVNVLDFALYLGTKSNEQCFSAFSLHIDKIKSVHTNLIKWHDRQCETLKIDIKEARRKNGGILALFEKPISMINDKWNYQPVDLDVINLVKEQTNDFNEKEFVNENLFNHDVQIFVKGNQYYYLPQNKE